MSSLYRHWIMSPCETQFVSLWNSTFTTRKDDHGYCDSDALWVGCWVEQQSCQEARGWVWVNQEDVWPQSCRTSLQYLPIHQGKCIFLSLQFINCAGNSFLFSMVYWFYTTLLPRTILTMWVWGHLSPITITSEHHVERSMALTTLSRGSPSGTMPFLEPRQTFQVCWSVAHQVQLGISHYIWNQCSQPICKKLKRWENLSNGYNDIINIALLSQDSTWRARMCVPVGSWERCMAASSVPGLSWNAIWWQTSSRSTRPLSRLPRRMSEGLWFSRKSTSFECWSKSSVLINNISIFSIFNAVNNDNNKKK